MKTAPYTIQQHVQMVEFFHIFVHFKALFVALLEKFERLFRWKPSLTKNIRGLSQQV